TQALVNGVVRWDVPTASLTEVEILAGGGKDMITIGSGNLDLLPFPTSVDGQGGGDTVIVNDQANPFGDTYYIQSTTLTRDYFGGLTYAGIAGLTLTAEAGSNTVSIYRTAAGTPVTVNAGAGNDTVNIGFGNLDTLPGAVTVNGQAGTDTVT